MEKLTLEQVLEEFPKECEAISSLVLLTWIGGNVERWYQRDLALSLLTVSALEWLAGKTIKIPGETGFAMSFSMPEDPLRWLLEEVREQLEDNEEA